MSDFQVDHVKQISPRGIVTHYRRYGWEGSDDCLMVPMRSNAAPFVYSSENDDLVFLTRKQAAEDIRESLRVNKMPKQE